jgi:hypothetical protein
VLLETFDRWFSALCAEGEGPLVMAYTSLVGDVGRRVRLYADPPGAADLPARERDLLAEGVLEGIGPRLEAIIGGRRFGGGRLLFAPETAG